jgi:hypothetical protein
MSEEQQTYDPSNEEHVSKRKKAHKDREAHKALALSTLLASEPGRMWMWDVLADCRVGYLSFDTDTHVMAFNEGRRQIGNSLIAQINRLDGGPELYMRMASENREKNS